MKIWRYMSIDKFKDMIKKRALYFARADQFCDPLEGTFPKGATTLFSALKMKDLNEFLSMAKSLRQSVAANCWHINDTESLEMWERYTENGQGVVVRSTLSRLKKSISSYTSDLIRTVKLQYITFSKAVLPPVLGLPFEFKDECYLKERELRCIIYRQNAITGTGIRVPVDIDTLIDAIYISPFAAKDFQDLVRATMKKYGTAKRVFMSRFKSPPFRDSRSREIEEVREEEKKNG
jgi:hypothetical protein